ncbi:aminopeptidase P family protein [Mycetocola spongiae]|uniref:aminopeptidase P family protein n=1 Tax=Mycetocola spongiae TaxID=2859226 RepID=UPI001CF32E7A|nr:aminopeptidase P family protein [Mycetocola spongiae]UCR89060.1 aminopeptidase P family protein [Mycetocola spongiae]
MDNPTETLSPTEPDARATTPASDRFRDYIGSHWAPREDVLPAPREQASFAAARRDALSAAFPGKRLVIPAGSPKQRSNDTDYPFRAHSAFAHLTGWGSDAEPDAVLVFEPAPAGHDVTLFFRERAGRDSDEFYANHAIGEFWIGPRPSLTQVAADLGIHTAQLDEFAATDADLTLEQDAKLTEFLSELRLVKDSYEIAQMREAVAATAAGFEDILEALPRVIDTPRGERVVEGVFNTRARIDGNAVGYDTIAASGAHACVLHWTRNDGAVRPGELILIDAGVEVDSLFTADITRTFPINGTFSDVQRAVYEAVREAADAALAIVRPGIVFKEIHAEAMRVIALHTAAWGMLPVSAEEALLPENQHHRRYMVHGTSHHLGIDVHDCAQARRDFYHDGIVEEGMVFTIEPGLYFQSDDLTVPEQFRGIGVRIEDDILVTADGAENLSAHIPRTADEVEAWMASKRS